MAELSEILAQNGCLDTILVSASSAFVGCLFADGANFAVTNWNNTQPSLSPPHEEACQACNALPNLETNIAAIQSTVGISICQPM